MGALTTFQLGVKSRPNRARVAQRISMPPCVATAPQREDEISASAFGADAAPDFLAEQVGERRSVTRSASQPSTKVLTEV